MKILFAAFTLFLIPLQAATTLGPVFRDSMILQRNKKVTVWGEADTGQSITVRFAGQTKTVDEQGGKWKLSLDPMTANDQSQSLEVEFRNGTKLINTIALKDVLIGDVYLAGGQSNMDLVLTFYVSKTGEAIINNPLVRFYNFPYRTAYDSAPKRGWPKSWAKCGDNTSTRYSSATAYYFATQLQPKVGVPIGIIKSAVGASPIQAWMSKETLMSDPGMAPVMNRKHDPELTDYKEPTMLYDQMIAPMVPVTLNGILWYQGESNTNDAPDIGHGNYAKLFKALITQWRSDFEDKTLPFLFVEVASFGGHKKGSDTFGNQNNWAYLRQAQAAALDLDNTAMVCSIDLGEKFEIHPATKPEVGRRLSLLARRMIYGEKLEASGPMVAGHKVENGKIIVSFEHTGKGLKLSHGPQLVGFEVASTDQVFHKAKAEIKGHTVEVSGIADPKHVRYAWKNWPEYDGVLANLCGSEGLPAAAFQTAPTRGGTWRTNGLQESALRLHFPL